MDDCGNRDPLGSVACGTLLILMAIGLVLLMKPAPRVGDGCEYFLMTMSLAEKGQPYSDPEVLAMYEAYQQSRDGSFLTGRDLEVYSNGLTLNGQRDFPHFWFFSLLCVPYYWFLKVLGGDIGHCFTLLNLTLLGLLLKVASANFGRRGLVVATALALASPLLWFVNKGHTEFFTVCLATTGVIWFLKKQYGRTVLALGIVSTQNPPFLLVALLVVALGIVRGGPKMVRHGVGCLAGMLVGCLHPLYYFIRHGNVTPQLITGAASGEGKGFREWTCFIVDPDVGLFSNWPWLIVPLIAVLAVTFWKKQKPDWSVICFCFLAVTILCWAQTKTNNFNHGGTIKISRYALWYLPFLYPLLDRFARNYPLVPVWQRGAAVAFLLAALVVNATKFYPDRKESFLFQTTIAENFYEVCPGLYNPIPEIFIERCLRAELPTDQWAISNRSGTKVIVHSGRLVKQQNWLRYGKKLDGIGGCEKRIDPEKLVRVIQQRDQTPDAIEWFYINAPGDIFLEMDVPVLSASDEPKNVLR